MYQHQVRELRQTKRPSSFEAQFAGVVGQGIEDDEVAVGTSVPCRGSRAAKAPVTGNKATMNEALILRLCKV